MLAEGTEEADEIRWLGGRGCRLFQGYGFARPMSAVDYAECIRSGELAAKSDAYRGSDVAAA